MSPLGTDRQFFAALIKADVPVLERMLTADFVLTDVMSGSEISKPAFLGFVGSRQIKFESITPAENRVHLSHDRCHHGPHGDERKAWRRPFAAHSRYTHVYAMELNEWRLIFAQGTQITPSPEA